MLKDSGPIGLSIMVVMAEGFLQVLEAKAMEEALHQQPPLVPLSFYRYVDDSHSRFKDTTDSESFLNVLNQQNEKIKYTMETENESKELQFLDIKCMNTGGGKYELDVYRKDAITNVQVKPKSSHEPQILRGIFKGFLNRAYRICSQKYLDQEIEFLLKVFEENGYNKNSLQKMVKETKSRLTTSEPTEENSKDAVIKQAITTVNSSSRASPCRIRA